MPDSRLPVGGLEEVAPGEPLPILDCNQCPLVVLLRDQIAVKDDRIADLEAGIEAQIAARESITPTLETE